MINFKKAVSIIVVFSLLLCSCGDSKDNVRETKVPDPVVKRVQMIHTVNGREVPASEDDVMNAGDDANPRGQLKNCRYDDKTDESVCEDKNGNSIRIAKYTYEGKHYTGKNDLQCIFENKGQGCVLSPVKCKSQAGSEECEPKYMHMQDAEHKDKEEAAEQFKKDKEEAEEKFEKAVKTVKAAIEESIAMTTKEAKAFEKNLKKDVVERFARMMAKERVPAVVAEMAKAKGASLEDRAKVAVKAVEWSPVDTKERAKITDKMMEAMKALMKAVAAEAVARELTVKSKEARAAAEAATNIWAVQYGAVTMNRVIKIVTVEVVEEEAVKARMALLRQKMTEKPIVEEDVRKWVKENVEQGANLVEEMVVLQKKNNNKLELKSNWVKTSAKWSPEMKKLKGTLMRAVVMAASMKLTVETKTAEERARVRVLAEMAVLKLQS